MKKKILGVMLSVLVLLVIVIAMAPAKTIWPIVTSKLPAKFQAIQSGEISGSIWNPHFKQIAYQNTAVNNVTADISVMSLIFAELKAGVVVEDPTLKLNGNLVATDKNLKVTELNFTIDAKRLDAHMEFPIKGLNGVISGLIDSAFFTSTGEWLSVDGLGSWDNAIINYLDESLDLGNFNFLIKTDKENNLLLVVSDNQGVLDLKGEIKFTPSKNYLIDVTTQQNLPSELETWIKSFGKKQNDRYRIQWNGKL